MQVILRADVRGVGRRGEQKDVSDGHALNFLIPGGFAVAATSAALSRVADDAAHAAARTRREARNAAYLKKALDGATVRIAARVSAGGTLYAAVGPAQVADALGKQGIAVIPEAIRMAPMKQPGIAEAVAVPAPGVRATFSVAVTAA